MLYAPGIIKINGIVEHGNPIEVVKVKSFRYRRLLIYEGVWVGGKGWGGWGRRLHHK